jgi:ABC transport system ATP-binding/permease protein
VGGYTDSIRQRDERREGGLVARPAPAAAALPPRGGAKSRKRSYKEQRELDALPAAIQALETEQARLETTLSDPQFFRRSPAQARASTERLKRLAEELEAAYARWEALESSG